MYYVDSTFGWCLGTNLHLGSTCSSEREREKGEFSFPPRTLMGQKSDENEKRAGESLNLLTTTGEERWRREREDGRKFYSPRQLPLETDLAVVAAVLSFLPSLVLFKSDSTTATRSRCTGCSKSTPSENERKSVLKYKALDPAAPIDPAAPLFTKIPKNEFRSRLPKSKLLQPH